MEECPETGAKGKEPFRGAGRRWDGLHTVATSTPNPAQIGTAGAGAHPALLQLPSLLSPNPAPTFPESFSRALLERVSRFALPYQKQKVAWPRLFQL